MSSTLLNENGLRVEYVSNFIDVKDADVYFSQLKELPFYQPTLNIRGKSVKPKRQVLAYGDEGLSYAFSGTEVPAEPWTPLMLELRDRVEKAVGCAFNYVLLNWYADGSSYISQHKDNEPGLDVTFPIAVLSFGAERVIEFKKPQTPSTCIKLEHGSLYTMERPTNKLFTHGIAVDPSVKSPRISLTFRHLLPDTVFPLAKKPRLDSKDSEMNVSSQDSFSGASENDFLPQDSETLNDSCDELSQNDWLVNFLKQDNVEPVLAEWSLKWNTFLQIVLDRNLKLRVHMRVFKETPHGDLSPTKNGLCMTQKTWFQFQSQLPHFQFQSEKDSFIANNQMVVMCVNEKFCVLQQMFPLNSDGFFLKPRVLKLSDDQIYHLCDFTFEITESLIKAMFFIQLPKLLQKSVPVCTHHYNEENAKIHFLNCVVNEIELCAEGLFKCIGCDFQANEQLSHECLTKSTYEKFQMNRQSVFLNLNMYNIVNNLKKDCSCFFHDPIFFKQFSVNAIEEYMLNIFSKKKM